MNKITTIIPTYRRQKLLIRAIDSAVSQTWKNISIVIRDNDPESPDNNSKLDIEKMDPRINYIKNAKNIGAIENFRQGLNNVKTDFFSFLSDDDYLEPDFYSEAMRLFEKHPDAGFVAFAVNTVDLDGQVLNVDLKDRSNSITSQFYNSDEGMEGYLSGTFPFIWTGYVFRRKVLQAIAFPEFSEVGFGADVYFIWHAAARFNFVVSNFKAANFTTHSDSTSSTLVKPFDERFLYWWRNRMLLIKNDPLVSDIVKDKISKHYITHSTKSFNSFQYYFRSAVLLILDRIKKKRYDDLKFDFIAMRSFLPLIVLIGIKFTVIALVYLKIDGKLRSLIRSIRAFI
jgi:GT2 family glycosyltransferase